MLLRLSSAVPAVKELGALAKNRRPLSLISTLVIHRQNVGSTSEELAKFFLDRKLGTGGCMPYHFIVRKDGTIEQAVPLRIVAPGAVKLNRSGVQIALHGDFRKAPPTEEQFNATVMLCATLQHAFNAHSIVEHTSVPGTTLTPGKICPGKYLDMRKLRQVCSEISIRGETYSFVL